MQTLIAPTINLVILLGVLAFYLRKPFGEFVRTRHTTLRHEIQSVRQMLGQSQEKYDEFSSKLKAMDAETAALRQQARQDAEVAKTRIIAEAQRLSANVISDAKVAVQSLYADTRGQLYGELVTRVLARTEQLLRDRLTGDDRARIRQEFSKQVETIQ